MVITSALHAEGRGFDPRPEYILVFVPRQVLLIRKSTFSHDGRKSELNLRQDWKALEMDGCKVACFNFPSSYLRWVWLMYQ